MTQYNTLNVKFSNSQLNRLKSPIQKRTEVTLNLSSNLIRSANDCPHKSLLLIHTIPKFVKLLQMVHQLI